MRRRNLGLLALGAMLVCGLALTAQPPGPGGRKKGPPDGKKGFDLGKVLPPHIRDGLDLTADQEAQLRDLENDVRTRLLRLLTDAQKQKLEQLRFRRPDGPPPDFDGPEGKKEPGNRKGPPDQEAPDAPQARTTGAGIAWYATLESGLREAKRTGRPILFVAAAPHCSGVSGTW